MKKIIFILFVSIQGIAHAQIIKGKASHVHDGDTFKLNQADGSFIRVRLANIDAPELNQPYGKRAQQFLDSIINNKMVEVKINDTDRFGRKVALIYINGIQINRLLVSQGLAWNYPKYSNDSELSQIENEAKLKKIGLWRYDNPVSPWQFRASR